MNAMISDLRNDDSAAVKRSDPVAVAMTMATTTTTRTMTMTTTMTMATTPMTPLFPQVLLNCSDCGNHAGKNYMPIAGNTRAASVSGRYDSPRIAQPYQWQRHHRTYLPLTCSSCKRCKRLQTYSVRTRPTHSFALTLEGADSAVLVCNVVDYRTHSGRG